MPEPRSFHPAAPWIWSALTLVGLAGSAVVAFVVAGASAAWGLGRVQGDLGLRLDLALFLALAGVLGILVVCLSGRVAFGRWMTVTRRSIVVPATGVVLALAVELTLHEWARRSYGYYDV